MVPGFLLLYSVRFSALGGFQVVGFYFSITNLAMMKPHYCSKYHELFSNYHRIVFGERLSTLMRNLLICFCRSG